MANAGVHILVYPFPGAGHIIPFLDLTHRLLNRGLTVTVLVTPNNLHLLDQLLSRHASSSLHPLVLPAPDPPAKFGLIPRMRALRELHYPLLLHWFHSHASPPLAIISDFFLGWTLSLASELGVPRLVFSPSGSFSISLNFSMCREPPRIDDPEDVDHIVSFNGLPNSPEFPCHQITLMYSWGVVLNTCSHLESIYIDHIKKEMGHDRVWAVGPLMVPDEDGDGDDANAMDLTNRVDASRPEKDRAKKLSEAALTAVKGGTSHKDLESFVKTVKELKAQQSD
ncbi:UDP-glucuronosyl/UDP-glucosyltransferase [Corchorus capsularis]|uniref:UDP-glucuronosyl/UDP-glucosyltransferase n=1 Tax=Corchorus capsularis TaxID=210143 RepID=A0A1R3HCB8_COCAP|nr:UDP-glucuronosyl/UDP-glucosyltransferase [Corchorus capsularis]